MELALRTGWTPDVLGSLPGAFRRACHWRLWVGAVVGAEGFPDTSAPDGASPEARLAYARTAVAVDRTRRAIFPEGD